MDETVRDQGIHSELRGQAEEILSHRPEAKRRLSPVEMYGLIHELQVQQIELELRNRELVETQTHLREAHRQFFDLYNLAPVGYFTIDDQGLITQANGWGHHAGG